MLSPADAARTILGALGALPTETVPLGQALDRVLATDIRSPLDLPPWDNSAMDGYAVRSEDVRGRCPVELQIIEELPAGTFPTSSVGAGQCTRIFTGAPIPEGTDGVVRQEHATRLETGRVRINDDRDAARNVRHRGEDVRRDALVLRRGTELGPAQIGILASIAEARVLLHRRPTVAIMASGDEIADLDEREAILAGRKIASSNSYTLTAMVRRAGGEPLDLGIARDQPGDLRQRLAAASGADLLVTSGAVSVGEHDHLRSVLESLGADMKFWRIRMRPGAPVGFGILHDLPWIGLPGNPVSTMVTFELFVRPAIRKLLGHVKPFRRTVPVRTGEPIALHARLQHFLRVVVAEAEGKLVAKLTGEQGSGILSSMAQADALMIVPEHQLEVPEGGAPAGPSSSPSSKSTSMG